MRRQWSWSAPMGSNSWSTKERPWFPIPFAICSPPPVSGNSFFLSREKLKPSCWIWITREFFVFFFYQRELCWDAAWRGEVSWDQRRCFGEDLSVFLLVSPVLQVNFCYNFSILVFGLNWDSRLTISTVNWDSGIWVELGILLFGWNWDWLNWDSRFTI